LFKIRILKTINLSLDYLKKRKTIVYYEQKIKMPKYQKNYNLKNKTMTLSQGNFRTKLIDNQINIKITTPESFEIL
jgi:hypothetical protein